MRKQIQCSALIIIILAAPSLIAAALPEIQVLFPTKYGDRQFILEFAQQPKDLRTGLSGRHELAANRGMLFDFSKPRRVAMWMKDTLIPLDIIFLDMDWKILAIYPNAQAGSLETISPEVKSRYVIELKANTAKELGLKPGLNVKIA